MISDVAFRWVLPEGTTTESPVLQYRVMHQHSEEFASWGLWNTVTLTVVTPKMFASALAQVREGSRHKEGFGT